MAFLNSPYGGTITGTDAGVCQDASAGVFNMYGGAITGNRVGADIPAEITMTVGGTARIIGNTKRMFSCTKRMKTQNQLSTLIQV